MGCAQSTPLRGVAARETKSPRQLKTSKTKIDSGEDRMKELDRKSSTEEKRNPNSFCVDIDAPAPLSGGSTSTTSNLEVRSQGGPCESISVALTAVDSSELRNNSDDSSDVPNPLGFRPTQTAGNGAATVRSVPSFENWSFHSAPAQSQPTSMLQMVAKCATPIEAVVEQRPGSGLQILSDTSAEKSIAGVLFEVCPALWDSRHATPQTLSITDDDEGRRASRSAGALLEPAHVPAQAYVLPPVLSGVNSFLSSMPSIDPSGMTADLEWLELHSRGRASPGFTTSEPEDPRWWEPHVRRYTQAA